MLYLGKIFLKITKLYFSVVWQGSYSRTLKDLELNSRIFKDLGPNSRTHKHLKDVKNHAHTMYKGFCLKTSVPIIIDFDSPSDVWPLCAFLSKLIKK